MFVFTLMQNRTYVDTVQTVLEAFADSRDICWSHTMKVLGSHVTFVSSSSLHVILWSNIHFDVMKIWSHMFAVNVQSVSVQQLKWDLIIWFTQMSDSFVVVVVVNVSNIQQVSYVILSAVLRTQYLSNLVSVSSYSCYCTVYWHYFPNEFFNQFLHTYCTFLTTLNYKFLFNYLELWRSYAILSATTQRIFIFH